MKKISKRLFATVMVVAMFAALSISASAASKSITVTDSGYKCVCRLTITKTSASASVTGTPIQGETVPIDPEVYVDLNAYNASGVNIGSFYTTGIESVSDSTGWASSYIGDHATCDYGFMGYGIASLSATV